MRRFSHAALSTYELCPHLYKLRFVDHAPFHREDFIARACGEAARLAIGRLCWAVMRGKQPTLRDTLKDTRRWWREFFREGMIIPAGTPEEHRNATLRCVANYYKAHFPFTEDRTLDTAMRVAAPLNDASGVVGFIDRLALRDGECEAHFFKTTTSPPRHDDPANERRWAFCSLGIQAEHPEVASIRLVWHYVILKLDFAADYSIEQAERFREPALRLIERIMAERSYHRKRSGLCNWCEYLEACNPFGDGRVPEPTAEPMERF